METWKLPRSGSRCVKWSPHPEGRRWALHREGCEGPSGETTLRTTSSTPAHEVVLAEEQEPSTPTRRVRSKMTLRMLQIKDDCGNFQYLEEIDKVEAESQQLQDTRAEAHEECRDLPLLSKAFIKNAEVQYTKDVEEVLNDLSGRGQPLQVVHNVSLDEVKKNLDKWKGSARKEYVNLKEAKEAFDVVKRKDLPADCRVVPGTSVFTVKPDGASFRRKTRFVACGNFVPADESLPDLFATGLDASSPRTMLSFTAKNVKDGTWQAALTDIRQAFVLAPWIGGPVGIQPPSIATMLGLCEPDDLWLVRKSLYGLREAPAVWAKFRDSVLRNVTWTTMRDGKEHHCALKQLTADEQIWRMVEVDTGTILGYALVYVDDVLMIGCPEVVKSFCGWLAEKWECDDLTVLSESSPLRFLGMEVHLTSEGYEVGQKGFVEELLRSHNHNGKLSPYQGSEMLGC